MAGLTLNMQALRRSRKPLRPGDIFVYRLKNLDFGFGRVIRTETGVFLTVSPGTCLVYFYSAVFRDKYPIPPLSRNKLLLPPKIIGGELWTLGYFENVGHEPLGREDVLPVHCFHSDIQGCYFDEYARPLRKRSEPCGSWGLTGYVLLDVILSEARGIPPHPSTIIDPEREFGRREVQPVTPTKSKRKRRGVEHAVMLCVKGPGKRGRRATFCDFVFGLEDRLEEAVTKAGAGRLDGNKIAMDLSSAVLFCYGKNADKLADTVLAAIKGTGLPRGSYLTKRHGKDGAPEERVDI
jgi:hypothetical protein